MNLPILYSSFKYVMRLETVTRLSKNIFEFNVSNGLDNLIIIKKKFTNSVTKRDIITATYLIDYIDDKVFLASSLNNLMYENVEMIYRFVKLFISKDIDIRRYGNKLFE